MTIAAAMMIAPLPPKIAASAAVPTRSSGAVWMPAMGSTTM